MKRVSILIPNGQFSIVNIGGAFQILNWANEAFFQHTRKPLFQVELIGHSQLSNDVGGFYSVRPSRTIEEVKKTDLIIIPAVHGPLRKVIDINKKTINWGVEQYHKGAEIAAFCVGTFLLAESGLLNGKTCSTHWGHAQELQEMYPEVIVRSEKIVTECEGLYTSGGAYAFTNLLVYLVEKYGGRELAIMTAKAFMVNMDKIDQSIFMIFNGQKDHNDELVLHIQEQLERSYTQKITVGSLAKDFHTNRRTLQRKFKSATGNSVIEYLQRVRVEAAKKILEQPKHNVSDAMYKSGYNDPKAFREVFKKFVGISPFQYKRKFRPFFQTLLICLFLAASV